MYSSRTFIIPVVLFTLVYNIPKFFELRVKTTCQELPTGDIKSENISDIRSENDEFIRNLTKQIDNRTDCNGTDRLIIEPTELRTNRTYITVYIMWMNLIVQVLIPFVLLIFLNFRVLFIYLFIY